MPNFERFAIVRVGSRGAKAFEFANQRVVFSITKSNVPTPNSGSISIWNLAGPTRDKIDNIGDAVELEAGYLQDDAGGRLVISADVLGVVTDKQGPDIITTIQLGDGVEFLKSKEALSSKAGTSVKEIITKLAGSKEFVLKSLDGIKDAAYANGFSEMGPIGGILDKLVGKLDAAWSIQNNELQVIDKLGSNDSPVFRIATDTGMIGSPTRDVDTSNVTAAPQSDGWKVITQLRPELGPGDRVEIESQIVDVSGIYHIQEVRHAGDTEQGDWSSTLRVKESVNA